MAKRHVKRALRRLFEVGQRLGFDVLPRHFYSEIPDMRRLRTTRRWREPYPLLGIEGADTAEQLAFVRSCSPPEVSEELARREVHKRACAENGAVGYGPAEADFLFAFVASRKPARILQLGSGVSTAVCLDAASFAGYEPRITCVDPFPTPFLRRAASENRIELLQIGAEDLEGSAVEQLGDDALFFVDSTHTLGPAGEVTRIVLELLPRLQRGAFAHFHDITMPYDYSRSILEEKLFFWHETALLMAFLTNNERFRIAASLSMLHYDAQAPLRESLPNYRPAPNRDHGLFAGPGHFPTSTYLEVVG